MDGLSALVFCVGVGVLAGISMKAAARKSRSTELDDEYRRLEAYVAGAASTARFPLFRAGLGSEESVVEKQGGIRTFDYRVERIEPERIERITCAEAPLTAHCPPLAISRKDATGLPGALLPDVAFEADVFNELVRVQCADARFAQALVDQRMMEWLLLLPARHGIQVEGSAALAYGPVTKPWEREPVESLLNDFLAHVPASLPSLYPAS